MSLRYVYIGPTSAFKFCFQRPGGFQYPLFSPIMHVLFSWKLKAHHFLLQISLSLLASIAPPISHGQPRTASPPLSYNNPRPDRPSLSRLYRRNREVALNLLTCSNKTFIVTSSRFSGIKVAQGFRSSPFHFGVASVTEEKNLLVSGPWVWQTHLSFFYCPSTSIPTFFFQL